MTYFDFAGWRREIEQAITRGETVPIRVLLDQMEAAYDDARHEAKDLQGMFDNAGDADDAAEAAA
jgi:hypothetical protein